MRQIRDRVVEICGRELECLVKYVHEDGCRLFAQAVPVIGGEYYADRHDEHVRSVCRALAAVERHKQTTSYSWANPLPLREEEFETFISNDCGALQLLGYFGRSWRWNDWDERHPPFDVFCSGVTEWFLSPPELRMDKELLQMFPPQKLAGLTTPLQWRSPNR
jgi:hypothetical protein